MTVPLSVTGRGGAMPADYEVSATELTFDAGQTSATFTVTAVDDNFDDDGESVAIAFVLPAGVTAAISRTARVMLADNDDPLGQVTMSLPAGCVLRDLVAGDEMPYSSYVSGCASLHIPGRNAHYYRLVVRQEGAVTLAVRSTTASHLLIRSASGEVIARYDEPGEIQFYRLSLTRTLEAGTYVIEVAAQWDHYSDRDRGHTLSYRGSTIARPGAYKLAGLSITDVNLAHFAPGTTEYSRNIAANVRTVTVTPTATLDDAEVTVMPPDADSSLDGRQVDTEADGVTEITVAVNSPMIVDAETVYRVVLRVRRELGRVFGRCDGVVPFAVPVVGAQRQVLHLAVGDLDAALVPVGVVGGLDGEPGLGGGGGDELDDGGDVGEGSASPVHGDEAEEAVLDLVPFAGAGRVVARR